MEYHISEYGQEASFESSKINNILFQILPETVMPPTRRSHSRNHHKKYEREHEPKRSPENNRRSDRYSFILLFKAAKLNNEIYLFV